MIHQMEVCVQHSNMALTWHWIRRRLQRAQRCIHESNIGYNIQLAFSTSFSIAFQYRLGTEFDVVQLVDHFR